MKKLIIGILLLITISVSAQLPQDKRLHLMAGTGIGWTASVFTVDRKPLVSFAWAVGSATTIGVIKELGYDKLLGKGTPEFKDALWTTVGGVTGWAAVQGFKLICKGIDKAIYRRHTLPRLKPL